MAPHLLLAVAILPATLSAGPVELRRHVIDRFPAGYQAAVADIDGDGRLDVIALSTEADRVDWYRNPDWSARPVARTPKNIDLAARDLDGDGRPEIVLASGFYFDEASRGGEIEWLKRGTEDASWSRHPIDRDPVVHRLRFGDLDGDGRPELVHAPIFGPGSKGAEDPKPAHLRAYRIPRNPEDRWEPLEIDSTLTILHGVHVSDLDGDGRDEVLTASSEGIHRYDLEGSGASARFRKTRIARGAAGAKPGLRGSSEVAPGKLGPGKPFVVAIEPWHGGTVALYTPGKEGEDWPRQVLDESLVEGHALLAADLDGDGCDEVVSGWRGAGGGLAVYARGADGAFHRSEVERGIAVECLVAADLNGDRRVDLVAIAGRSNLLVWYENLGPAGK